MPSPRAGETKRSVSSSSRLSVDLRRGRAGQRCEIDVERILSRLDFKLKIVRGRSRQRYFRVGRAHFHDVFAQNGPIMEFVGRERIFSLCIGEPLRRLSRISISLVPGDRGERDHPLRHGDALAGEFSTDFPRPPNVTLRAGATTQNQAAQKNLTSPHLQPIQ